MTTTQAQIDAAAWEIVRGSGHTISINDARVIAKAALTAAAGVDDWPSDELVNDLVASATEEDRLTKHNPSMKPLNDDEADAIRDAIRLARQSERERCAEECECDACAAAIRALRDETVMGEAALGLVIILAFLFWIYGTHNVD